MWQKYLTWGYYSDILSGRSRYRTFFVLVLFSFVFTLYYSFLVLRAGMPFATNFSKRVNTVINETVPGDLTVRIKNGLVSTNVTEPYYVTLKKEYLESLSGLTKMDTSSVSKIRILTIDTKADPENFEQYQTLALLTDSSLVYYNEENVTIYPLRDIEDFIFNKQKVLDWFSDINEGNGLGTILVVLLFISPLFIFLGILMGLLFSYLYFAFLVYIMARLYKTGASFMNVYRYTVALTVVPVFVWSLILLLPWATEYLGGLDPLHTIGILGLCYLGVRELGMQQLKMKQ